MKNTILIIFLLFINPSFAAEWIFMNHMKNGAKVYSAETYVLEDDTIRTYLKVTKGKNSTDPYAILIQCSSRTFRTYVAGDFGSEFYHPWQPIIPDSSYEVAVNYHCKDFKTYKELVDIKNNKDNTTKENSISSNLSNKDFNSLNPSYLSRLGRRVKPNIIFSDIQLSSVVGNPATELEVTCSPSGQIVNIRLLRSSGDDGWDSAAMNAIEKTGIFPKDEMGNMPSKIVFIMRPRD